MNAPRIVRGMSFEDYQIQPELSKSQLDWIFQSPLHYRQFRDGERTREETSALSMGRIIHSAVLENRREYVTRPEGPEGDFRTKAGKDWRDAQELPIIDDDSANLVSSIRYAVHSDPQAADVLKDCDFEVSIFGNVFGREMRGRCDALNVNRRIVADLKTVDCAACWALSSAIDKYRWHVQAALYLNILNQLYPGEPQWTWYFIAAEKSIPVMVNVRRLETSSIDLGKSLLHDAIETLDECEATGIWPGYSEPGTKAGTIGVPQKAHDRYAASLQLEGAIEA